MGAFPSGQWGQTVNLLLNASVVRIHQLPPKRTRNLGCGFFFVLELVGFEQVGRPQTAKNSPADCFLDRGLRIHQLPPKSRGKDIATAFFFAVSHKIGKGSDRFSKCVLLRCPTASGRLDFFVANLFCCFQNVKAIPHNSKCRYGERGAAAGDRGAVHAHPVKSETGHRITAGTCNPGGKQV